MQKSPLLCAVFSVSPWISFHKHYAASKLFYLKHYAASKLFYLKKEYIVVIGKKVQQGRARRRPALFGLSAP